MMPAEEEEDEEFDAEYASDFEEEKPKKVNKP